MVKYLVELDGAELIESKKELSKGSLVRINNDREIVYSKVSNVDGNSVSFRHIKYTEPIDTDTKNVFTIMDCKEYGFENRLSKNQMILVDDMLLKIVDIDKKTKKVTVDTLDIINADCVFGVYETLEGKTSRDRELNGYSALGYFKNKAEGMSFVWKNRANGIKCSL